MILRYRAKRNKVPVIMDEVRTFVEVMAVVKEGDYRDRGTTMTDDIVAMAEQKQLYLVQFCQREAIRIKL